MNPKCCVCGSGDHTAQQCPKICSNCKRFHFELVFGYCISKEPPHKSEEPPHKSEEPHRESKKLLQLIL